MALRLLEAVVPREALPGLNGVLEEEGAVGVSSSHVGEDLGLLRMLVRADRAEALTDLLASRFGDDPRFRVVLLAVEATLPPLEEEESSAPEPAANGPLRISREELHQDLAAATRISSVYLTTVALSTLVAAVGLTASNVAVVIGAMVIAPLLGPNVALSLAATLGDVGLARRAFGATVAGGGVALALAALYGAVLPIDPSVPEIASRTSVGPGDVVLALSAGAAGTLAFTQGLSAAVIGVMVAVALLPPLVATGLLLGSGHADLAYGAFLLASVNVVSVNLAGVVTFLVQRVRPRTWWEAERAQKAVRVAVASWIGMLALLILLIWL